MRLLLVLAALSFAFASAAQPIARPTMGQSARQQEQDTLQCQAWARQAVGTDSAAAGASTPDALPPGEHARGALEGARIGGSIGGLSDHAGEAAAAGAALGPRSRGAGQSPAQTEASTLDEAFAVCMSRRGYTFR
jgi:hypothetical protein